MGSILREEKNARRKSQKGFESVHHKKLINV
jgi:hypothetical protein